MTNALKIGYIGEKGILFKGDCLDVLRNIKDDSIDLIFTDPPFNLKKDYGDDDFTDDKLDSDYLEWCKIWLRQCIRVLRPGGSLAIYHWPRWLIELGAWLNGQPDLKYRSLIALKMKSGFPIKGRLHPAHYGILYYVKKGAKPTFNVVRQKTPICRHCGKEIRDYGGYRKKFQQFEDEEGIPWIQISDFWDDTRPARQDKARKNSINELPFHIPERIILMASQPGDIVLDLFGGGGSTFHAAQVNGRYWIGSEIGDLKPALSRFSALWGSEEKEEIPEKLSSCFTKDFISNKVKLEKSTYSIATVDPMNIKAINGDIHSKSRVIQPKIKQPDHHQQHLE